MAILKQSDIDKIARRHKLNDPATKASLSEKIIQSLEARKIEAKERPAAESPWEDGYDEGSLDEINHLIRRVKEIAFQHDSD